MRAKVTEDIENAQFMDGGTIPIRAGSEFEVCGAIYHDKNIYVHANGGHLILPRNKVKVSKK